MALLESLGRSGALSESVKNLRGYFSERRAEEEGKTRLAMEESESKQRMNLLSEQVEAARYQRQQWEEKEADLDTEYPIDMLKSKLGNDPNLPLYYEFAKKSGWVKQNEAIGGETISKRNLAKMRDSMTQENEFTLSLAQNTYKSSAIKQAQLQQALQNPKIKPEEKAALEQELKNTEGMMTQATAAASSIDRALKQKENQLKMQQDLLTEMGKSQIQESREKNVATHKASLVEKIKKATVKAGGKIGGTYEEIKAKIAASKARNPLKELSEGEKYVLALHTKTTDTALNEIALKLATKELLDDPQFKMKAKTDEQKNALIKQRVDAYKKMIQGYQSDIEGIAPEDVEDMPYPLSGVPGVEDLSDEELIKRLD